MSNRRYISPQSLSLKRDLENIKKNLAASESKSRSAGPKVKVFGNIIRIQNKNFPSKRVAISASILERIRTAQRKELVFFAWCPEHGYGKFVAVKEVKSSASGKAMYLVECKKCLVAKTKKKESIFEKVFKIFKRRGE